MNCRHVKHNLEAYVRHELDAESEKQITAHLAVCANCRSLHDAVFAIHIALQDLPRQKARGDFNEKALEKLATLQAAQTTVQRVDAIAHARLSPWRRCILWLDSLVPRALFRYASPAMAGVVLGLILAFAILFTPRGQQTIQVVRQAGEVGFWKHLTAGDWSGAEPNATPFATQKPQSLPQTTPLPGTVPRRGENE